MTKIMRTFEIKQEMFDLEEMMLTEYDVNEETGEIIDNTEELKALADGLKGVISDKADAIIYISKEFKMSEDALSAEIKRLQERKSMMKRKQDQLKDLLDYLLGGEKLKTEKFTIFYGKSESLEIEDESAVPADYIAFTPKINKTELKKDVKSGAVEVDGIKLHTNVSVRWR